jgi:hypothetical protein
MATDLERQLTGLKQGDHICPIYENATEQMAVAIPFLKEGLVRGERCLYIADDQTALQITQALEAASVDVAHEQARGALSILTKRETYLKSGDEFDPQAMIDFLRQAEVQAIADGFSGLRVLGEMTWVLGREGGGASRESQENWLGRSLALPIGCSNMKLWSTSFWKTVGPWFFANTIASASTRP